MKTIWLCLLLSAPLLRGGTLLLSDNFNAPDTGNLDTSDQTGRRSGLLGPDVQLRSSRIQHGISANQLNFLKHPTSGSGRIRFQQVASLPTNVWTDFAGGISGTTILAEGGIRLSFDWTPADNTSTTWVSFNAGFPSLANLAEPATRVNHAGTDIGILFRNNGGTQYFDNGVATAGTNFDVSTLTTHKVVVSLAFASFADGSNLTVKATVDGISVLPDGYTVQWADNLGVLNLELGNLATGTKLDNFALSGLNGLSMTMAAPPFLSSIANGGTVGTLASQANDLDEPATYTLVAGAGDTDNGKFTLTGNLLKSNGFDFQSLADGTPLSVRIKGTGTTSGLSNEQTFPLMVMADSDADDLPDTWESATAFNLTDLKGRNPATGPGAGTGNYDGDTLTDLQEYQISRTLYPSLSPLLADTDGDGLEDGAEITPTAPRVATNPTLADTDKDGLSDFVETNSGIFLNAADPGSSPLDYDSDDDLFPDGYEILRGGNPLDALIKPALPAPLTTFVLTTDESSGISPAKTYTHAFSGGYPATINGVALPALTATLPVAGFGWTANASATTAATLNQIAVSTPLNWVPGNGNVTGTGLLDLFGGFTYSSSGANSGGFQRYQLTGLTPGQKYDLRLYSRMYSNAGSGRPLSLTFTNGSQSVNAYVLEDRPGLMLGNGNNDSAWYLSFPYTAEGTDLMIEAAVPWTTIATSGSWHLYGLTNEIAAESSFVITSLTLQNTPVPAAVIRFNSEPGAVYAVDYSSSLAATGQPGGWTALTTTLASEGTSTTWTDSSAVGSGPRIFYRIRRLSP